MPKHPGKTPRRKSVDAHAKNRKGTGQAKVDVKTTAERVRAHRQQMSGRPLSAAQKLIRNPKATKEQQEEATRALRKSRKKRKK